MSKALQITILIILTPLICWPVFFRLNNWLTPKLKKILSRDPGLHRLFFFSVFNLQICGVVVILMRAPTIY